MLIVFIIKRRGQAKSSPIENCYHLSSGCPRETLPLIIALRDVRRDFASRPEKFFASEKKLFCGTYPELQALVAVIL